MGKYIRKAKTAGGAADLAVMETSLGVRTRAKTLAAKSQAPPPPSLPTTNSSAAAAASYLQLRSRRLLKPPISLPTHYTKRQKESNPKPSTDPGASTRLRMASSDSVGSYLNNNDDNNNNISEETLKRSSFEDSREDAAVGREEVLLENDNKSCSKCDLAGGCGHGEASFGDNVLEFEGRERSTRESTPSSLIRDPDVVVRTPGSTTRPTSLTGTNRRIPDSDWRHIPTSHEMDEFFAGAEEEQQRTFIEKYNFDPVNDKPLPGRYEWEKLDSSNRK